MAPDFHSVIVFCVVFAVLHSVNQRDGANTGRVVLVLPYSRPYAWGPNCATIHDCGVR